MTHRFSKAFVFSVVFFSVCQRLRKLFHKSTLPGEIVDGGTCGSRDRVLGVVGVFKTGKNTSFAFVSIFDVAFLLWCFSKEGNDRVILTLHRTFVASVMMKVERDIPSIV